MTAAPYLCRSLATLRRQVDAAFPKRSTKSDGWIGDASHQAAGSYLVTQHNPNPAGAVCALDITEDLSVGLDCDVLMDQLDDLDDPRFFYSIHDGQIENSDDTRTPYFGPSKHTRHLHVSARPWKPSVYDDPREWDLPMLTGRRPVRTPSKPRPSTVERKVPAWPLPPNHWFGHLRGGARSHGGFYARERGPVRLVQQALQRWGYAPARRGWADGYFGDATAAAVARWQRDHMPGTKFYGAVWADDWRKLLSR